jgi:hypothetical protein
VAGWPASWPRGPKASPLARVGGAEARGSWLGPYLEWAESAAAREEYHAFLRERFASLKG